MAKKAKNKALPSNPLITLRTKSKSKNQEFELGHALRLLRLPNSAWEIKDDNYLFKGNDIKRRPSKRPNTSPEE